MSSFTLDGGQAAGTGLGNLFKAFVLGPQAREQARAAAEQESAKTYAANMQGNKYGSEAQLDQHKLALQSDALGQVMNRLGVPLNQRGAVQQKLDTGSFGAQYDALPEGMAGPAMPAPVDNDKMAKLGEYLALAQQMYGTGSNVDQAASAQLKQQQGSYIDRVAADPSQAGAVGRAYAATDGKPIFDAVGTTGQTLDRFTGQAGAANAVLAKLFGAESGSKTAENLAQANSANASAGNSSASAALTKQKTDYFNKNGSLPGNGASGSEGALSSTILRTLDKPLLDAKGRPVSNPMTGQVMTATDPQQLTSFYKWTSANKRQPTATAFAEWEAQGRPAGFGETPANKNPPAPPAGGRITLPPGVTSSEAIAQAKQAIAAGKDRDAVIKRLQDMGVDTKGL